ncbi:Cell growth regulator with RING finger domain protein 1 [Balamuthia mandrillaris]
MHAHPLHEVTSLDLWYCNSCRRQGLSRSDKRYRCGQCGDYDECSNCAPSSRHSHPLKLVTFSAAYDHWWCDSCKALLPHKRYRCYTCADFDLCQACFNNHVQASSPTSSLSNASAATPSLAPTSSAGPSSPSPSFSSTGSSAPSEDTVGEGLECLVCVERQKEILFRPCNHVCCCGTCGVRLSSCPMCRATITSQERVYL